MIDSGLATQYFGPKPRFDVLLAGWSITKNIEKLPMEHEIDIPRLIVLRKLTTALSDHFERQLSGYLANLASMLNPRAYLGEYIRGEKQVVKGAELTFQELQKLYQSVAAAAPFRTSTEIKSPIDVFGAMPEISPASYVYKPTGSDKKITIRSPLKWVLSYKGQGPRRLRELIVMHAQGGGSELQEALLHGLIMRIITSKQPGIAPILEALRFFITSNTVEEFGRLPLTYISAPLSTIRPPDEIIIQSTEISGANTFDEVVNIDDIVRLSDPIAVQIKTIVQDHAGALFAEINPKSLGRNDV